MKNPPTDTHAAFPEGSKSIDQLGGLINYTPGGGQVLPPVNDLSLPAAAVEYAKAGYRVFPLQPGTKLPMPHFPWSKTASKDPELVETWWRYWPTANIGLVLGPDSGPGVVALDIDVKKGQDGLASYHAITQEPYTGPIQKTPSGGEHRLFRYVEGLKNFTHKGEYGGLDMRTDNGYIVVSPSVTADGQYRWVQDGPILPMPAALLDRCREWSRRSDTDSGDAPGAVPDIPEDEDLPDYHYLTPRLDQKYLNYLDKGDTSPWGNDESCAIYNVAGALARRCQDDSTVYGIMAANPYAWSCAERHARNGNPAGWLWKYGIGKMVRKVTSSHDPHSVFDSTTGSTPSVPTNGTGNPPPAGAAPSGPANGGGTRLELIDASSIEPEPIDWVWPDYLARGKLHILAGSPGTGKTTLALGMAATITRGGTWPDGSRAPRGRVLMWSGEDSPKDTLIPRLMAAGADRSRVQFVGNIVTAANEIQRFDLGYDVSLLEETIAQMPERPAMIIVDPIVSAVTGDSHKNTETRRALEPLVKLAERIDAVLVGITHLTKGTKGREPLERVTGSLAFGAAARLVLMTVRRPDDHPDGPARMLVRAKNNIGKDGGGFHYEIKERNLTEAGHPRLSATCSEWGDPVTGTARSLLDQAEVDIDSKTSATDEAVEFLLDVLADGKMKAADIKREAREAGITERPLRLARERLGIKPKKGGFSDGWTWELPPAPPPPVERETATGTEGGAVSENGPAQPAPPPPPPVEWEKGTPPWRL